jgi:hypothetical protein
MRLGAMLRRERHVGQHVRLGLVQEGGKLWQLGTQTGSNPAGGANKINHLMKCWDLEHA